MTFSTRNSHMIFFGVLLMALPTLALCKTEPLPPADIVHTVWDLSMQPCNGGGGNLLTPDPNRDAVVKSKTLDVPAIGFSFSIPQLPDLKETVVKLFLNDHSRGVTDHYFLISEHDLDAPIAAIVVTELPEGMRSTQKAFDAVRILQSNSAKPVGLSPALTSITGPYGDALELLVPNRVGTYCFPTSNYKLIPNDMNAHSIGISRFVVIKNVLVEFALILNIRDMKEPQAVVYARKIMDRFWLGIKPI